jgi:hypothetical protein
MGTKNNPGDFDCYAAAKPDEPMFVLLARDRHAPSLVWLWASLREMDNEDPAKVEEARICAYKMLKWAAQHDRPTVGLGQTAIIGVMELMRAVISTAPLLPQQKSGETDIEWARRFLARMVAP